MSAGRAGTPTRRQDALGTRARGRRLWDLGWDWGPVAVGLAVVGTHWWRWEDAGRGLWELGVPVVLTLLLVTHLGLRWWLWRERRALRRLTDALDRQVVALLALPSEPRMARLQELRRERQR